MLFSIRLILSLIQFLLIAKSNIFLNEVDNSVFIFGLRFFIIFAPLIIFFLRGSTAPIIFGIIVLGQLFLIFMEIKIVAILVLSFSLSIAAFLIRLKAAENISDASLNKVALHLGSILSGFLIYLVLNHEQLFWWTSIFLSFICFSLAIVFFRTNTVEANREVSFSNLKEYFFKKPSFKSIFWSFSGISLGIRSYAPYIILPQFLIYKIGYLPEWYGLQISIYSVLVILFQIPTSLFKTSFSLKVAFLSLLLTNIIVGIPCLFSVESFIGSSIWLFLIASQEIFSGTMDSASHRDNALFAKEIFVGIGGGISTFLMRFTNEALWSGSLSCLTAILCINFIFKAKKLLNEHTSNV